MSIRTMCGGERSLRAIRLVLSLAVAAVLGASLACQSGEKAIPVVAGRVLDAAGAPVSGAKVEAYRVSHPELPRQVAAFLSPRPVLAMQTRSDQQGRFRLELESHRAMVLLARHADSGMSELLGPITPGEYRVLKLRRNRILAGKVRGRDGRPLRAVEVSAHLRLDETQASTIEERDSHTVFLVDSTDEKGGYSLEIPSSYERWITCNFQGKSYEFRLGKGIPSYVLPEYQVTVGMVRGREGRPVAGAQVFERSNPLNRTRTSVAGRFELGIGRGALLHIVSESAGSILIPCSATLKTPRRASTIWLRPGLGFKARLLDGTGKPLSGARVLCCSTSSQQVDCWEGKLDEKGKLSLWCLKRQEAFDAFVEYRGRFVWFYSGAPTRDVSLDDVTIKPTARISGRITTATREPAVGARVYLLKLSPKGRPLPNLPIQSPPKLSTIADRGGRFHFDGLQSGHYEVAILAFGHPPRFVRMRATSVGKTVVLRYAHRSSVLGVVVNKRREPVSGAVVRTGVKSSHRTRRFGLLHLIAISDERGRFAFHSLPRRGVMIHVVARASNGGLLRGAKSVEQSSRGRGRVKVRIVLEAETGR